MIFKKSYIRSISILGFVLSIFLRLVAQNLIPFLGDNNYTYEMFFTFNAIGLSVIALSNILINRNLSFIILWGWAFLLLIHNIFYTYNYYNPKLTYNKNTITSLLCSVVFIIASYNVYDTYYFPTHKIITNDKLYFLLDALGWVILFIYYRYNLYTYEGFKKTIADSGIFLSLFNLYSELAGLASVYTLDKWFFINLWLIVVAFIAILRTIGGVRKNLYGLCKYFRLNKYMDSLNEYIIKFLNKLHHNHLR